MKITTQAIVLHLAKYTDRASLLHLYTRQFGRMTYMIYGLRSKKNISSQAIFEPLSIVEIEATHNVGRDIQTLNNISLCYLANNTLSDISRRSVAIFIAETLFRTLYHPDDDQQLFEFVKHTIKVLNETDTPQNIHLNFLLQYTYYLGIMPSLDEQGKYLDIKTGMLVSNKSDLCFTDEETSVLIELCKDNSPFISRQMRQKLLEKLCTYYEYHLTDFFTPKSLEVLKEVFD